MLSTQLGHKSEEVNFNTALVAYLSDPKCHFDIFLEQGTNESSILMVSGHTECKNR